ncbi:MAG: ATP phosphoribosyltransferase regulatory subunit [Chloroflexi bacterium]|nr:ATP phosphoribosyltransferase regulatory subunit [Chloroflexota bacterium]
MARFRSVERIFRDCCLKWGYGEVRTPTLEYLHLFTSTGTLTPSRLRRVYSFLDWDGWSGERVVLRPDGTIPIARLYIDTMAGRKPARLFYVSNVFSFEETGTEAREKWQCGVELIGGGSPMADIELIMLSTDVLKKLGMTGIGMKLSHAGVIRALLSEFGLSHDEQTQVVDQILDGDLGILSGLKPERPELGKALVALLDLKGRSSGFLKNMKSLFSRDLPALNAPFDSFVEVVERLEAAGYQCQIDIPSARGFEYYTGPMFQLVVGDQLVGGGGRYDALIPLLGGPDTPASGFVLYMDRLMELIKPGAEAKQAEILVKSTTRASASARVFDLACRLREGGFIATIGLGGEELASARWVVEVRNRPAGYVLTDQNTRRKREVASEDELFDLLRRVKRGSLAKRAGG